MIEKTKTFIINSEKELTAIAEYIIASNYSKIICLSGDLGAGKTTFVKAFCNLIEVDDQVSSPTFSLVNEYRYSDGVIYHLDLYRLESVEDALDIGIEEYLDSKNYCLIEWPELIQELLLGKYVDVKISTGKGNSRNLLISFK